MSRALFSRLYDCQVTHSRERPVRHAFSYRYFTFCLDLDEVTALSAKSRLFGTRFFRAFRFAAEDYIFGGPGKTPGDVKQAVVAYARAKGIADPIERVELIAHVRTLGYGFNPAAFYFCYGEDDSLLCGVLEVTNTFGEKKAYFVPPAMQKPGALRATRPKLFYVSPFVALDSEFELDFDPPTDRLRLRIASKRAGAEAVHAGVQGQRVAFSDGALLRRLVAYPWVTLAVIARIHYQAARLYLKKVPFIRKKEQMELQIGGLS